MIRLRFSIAGLISIGSIMAVVTMVQLFIISPALHQLSNGNYGEMYGPVSALRWPFYLFMLALAAVAFWYFFIVKE
jgi:hypothetical protein